LRGIPVILALAGLAWSAAAAGHQAPAPNATKATGTLPDGWKARPDDPAAKPDSLHVSAEKDSLTFASGPAAIYYKPDAKAEKGYTVSATFSQLKPTPQPQPYGLFVGGADLDKDTARYTALLIRADGQYQISTWSGGKATVVVAWTRAAAMADPKGVKTSNTLMIRALDSTVHFLIGERDVHQMPRAKAGADGIAGIRIGSGLNVQVDRFDVKKLP
jgi:hypothetical protein